jgi:MFS family permease
MKEKNNIIVQEESMKITAATAGAAPIQFPGKVISVFPALAHRNFQLYFIGQVISLIGFWLQQVGLGWLVFQVTNSAFWVGAAIGIAILPSLFFSTFAGVYIDKVNKKKLLIFTQSSEAIIATIFGFLILTTDIHLTTIITIVFINGMIFAVDMPTRLTFVVDMVGKKDLASAVPINAGIFNAARFVGPALAGLLIATLGVGWTFVLNGISFIPAIIALILIRPLQINIVEKHLKPLDSLKEGLKFSFTHHQIFYFMILAAITAIFLWPHQTLMPVIAERVFSSGPKGLGTLLAASGAGSLLGSIFTSSQSRRKNKGKLILYGLVSGCITIVLFSINRNFIFAHILLFIIGFSMMMYITTVNTLVQLASPDKMRGRIMAVYLTMFVGMMPFGNILMGFVAEKTSAIFAVGLGGIIVLSIGAVLYLKGVFKNFSD